VKITPKGRKVFIVLYRTGGAGSYLRKYTIGSYGRVTLHQARVAVQKVFAAPRPKIHAIYYNEMGTHRSLDKDAPISRPVQRSGNIISHAFLDELHHHYVRV
jgi:hypothetical protein